jgi:hypothetical protein
MLRQGHRQFIEACSNGYRGHRWYIEARLLIYRGYQWFIDNRIEVPIEVGIEVW